MNQKNANYIKAVEKIKFIMGDQSIPTLPEVEEQFLELYNQYLGAIEEVEKELSSEDMIFKVKLMILGRFNAWRKKLISLKSVSSVQSSILSFMESMEKEFKPAPIESSKKIQCTFVHLEVYLNKDVFAELLSGDKVRLTQFSF